MELPLSLLLVLYALLLSTLNCFGQPIAHYLFIYFYFLCVFYHKHLLQYLMWPRSYIDLVICFSHRGRVSQAGDSPLCPKTEQMGPQPIPQE